jgi:hypothetical protein
MRKKRKTSKTTLPPEVAEVAERLRVWRETREAGPRIPEKLWRRAGELARRHGVSPISTALRLHYYDLQRHTFPEKGPPARRRPAFIELARPAIAAPSESWTVELHRPSGSKLTLRLPRATAKELLPLVQTFLRS